VEILLPPAQQRAVQDQHQIEVRDLAIVEVQWIMHQVAAEAQEAPAEVVVEAVAAVVEAQSIYLSLEVKHKDFLDELKKYVGFQ
jgi:allophanate hydrolase subunit 1